MSEEIQEEKGPREQIVGRYGNTAFKLVLTQGSVITELDLSSSPRTFQRQLTNLLLQLPELQTRLGVAEGEAAPLAVKTVTGNYSATTEDAVILVDCSANPVTVILPPAAYQGLALILIKIDSTSNAVTVQTQGSDSVQGSSSKSLASQWSKVSIVANGVSLWVDLSTGGV